MSKCLLCRLFSLFRPINHARFPSASHNPLCPPTYLGAQKNRSAFRKPVLTSCSCLLRRAFCLLTCDARFARRAFCRILAARFIKRAICAMQHRQCFATILLCIVRKAIRFFFIHSDHILRSRFRHALRTVLWRTQRERPLRRERFIQTRCSSEGTAQVCHQFPTRFQPNLCTLCGVVVPFIGY